LDLEEHHPIIENLLCGDKAAKEPIQGPKGAHEPTPRKEFKEPKSGKEPMTKKKDQGAQRRKSPHEPKAEERFPKAKDIQGEERAQGHEPIQLYSKAKGAQGEERAHSRDLFCSSKVDECLTW
jgi:hypothetical protein